MAGVLPEGRPRLVRQLTEQGFEVWRYLSCPNNAEAGRCETWRAQTSVTARSCAASHCLELGWLPEAV